nr:MAG TPA: hypothetical protein [Microviridae sp.]
MKAKKNDWIVKVTYVSEDLQYVVKYINVLKSTKSEVIRYTQSFPENVVINIYKSETIL